MFSFPLFERLKAEVPEFDQLTAFQAGGFRVSVRRPGIDVAARSLRTEYVTGNYFTTFGIGASGGRVFTADDDTPASPPVVVLSHHSWQARIAGRHRRRATAALARAALLVLQATLSIVLVAGATMLGRSLSNVEHQDFGYDVRDRVLVAMNRPVASYTVPRLTAM